MILDAINVEKAHSKFICSLHYCRRHLSKMYTNSIVCVYNWHISVICALFSFRPKDHFSRLPKNFTWQRENQDIDKPSTCWAPCAISAVTRLLYIPKCKLRLSDCTLSPEAEQCWLKVRSDVFVASLLTAMFR